jgi:hypothetical protein
MPLYHFECIQCGQVVRKILKAQDLAQTEVLCCDTPCRRTPRPPSTQVKEVLDNGLMTKKVERLSDAERLFRERALIPEDR